MSVATEAPSTLADSAPTPAENGDALVQQVIDQLQSLQEIIRKRDKEIADLRAQFKQVEMERDVYRESLYMIDAKNLRSFTEEEIREINENGLDLGELVDELKKELENSK